MTCAQTNHHSTRLYFSLSFFVALVLLDALAYFNKNENRNNKPTVIKKKKWVSDHFNWVRDLNPTICGYVAEG